MGEVQSSCAGGRGPVGMKAVGVVVAEGTAAGGFSVRGLADELEAAELEVAVPEELGMAEEAVLLAFEAALVVIALAVLTALLREGDAEEEAS